ncbi:MAG: precorrin-2 C(20)-methyltransferase [Rhodospirillales bacterium]|jgi:precorrin-2/cobalt-factor-2 C20-methyltransferase
MNANIKIWGLGIGPGDPDLITVKALKILQAADVIAYPAPADGESLVRSIAAPHMSGTQEEIVIATPMVVERHPAQDVYDKAASEIAAAVDAGKSVAVLCEGDPFFYGSFMYLFARLSENYAVQVVPGVSSLAACSAELALPLAARNDVVTVIPGPLDEETLEQQLMATNVAAIIKVGRHLGKIKRVLEKIGATDNAHYIERATMKNQKIVPLSDLNDDSAPYFSMIIVRRSGEILEL